jgi:hypothetical protein
MRNQLLLGAALFIIGTSYPALPQGAETTNLPTAFAKEEPRNTLPSSAQLSQIIGWIAVNLDLPEVRELPRIELVTPARMAAVRFRGLVSDRDSLAAEAGRTAPPEFGQDVYAVYDDVKQAIYLHKDWNSDRPADISVLVHELVHHIQNVAALKFACPQEREKDAYKAQRTWLEQFGRTLEDVFEIDPMTILVRTTCGF